MIWFDSEAFLSDFKAGKVEVRTANAGELYEITNYLVNEAHLSSETSRKILRGGRVDWSVVFYRDGTLVYSLSSYAGLHNTIKYSELPVIYPDTPFPAANDSDFLDLLGVSAHGS